MYAQTLFYVRIGSLYCSYVISNFPCTPNRELVMSRPKTQQSDMYANQCLRTYLGDRLSRLNENKQKMSVENPCVLCQFLGRPSLYVQRRANRPGVQRSIQIFMKSCAPTPLPLLRQYTVAKIILERRCRGANPDTKTHSNVAHHAATQHILGMYHYFDQRQTSSLTDNGPQRRGPGNLELHDEGERAHQDRQDCVREDEETDVHAAGGKKHVGGDDKADKQEQHPQRAPTGRRRIRQHKFIAVGDSGAGGGWGRGRRGVEQKC